MAGEDNVFRLEAGAPVTETEVFAACDALVAAGDEVTRRAVYRRIGRGSMTTINRLVTLWEERQRAHIEARDVDLSPEETERILLFGRQVLRDLTERVRREAAVREQEKDDTIAREQRRAAELSAAYDELVDETKVQVATFKAEIQALRAELEQARSDADAATSVASNLEDQLKTQTALTGVAETRAREAEGRVEAAVATAAEARGRADALAADIERARSTERSLRDELAAVFDVGKEQAAQLATVNASLSEQTVQLERGRQTEQDLRAELATAASALATAQATIAEQMAQLAAARSAEVRLQELVQATDRRAEHEAADRQAAEQRAASAKAAQARLEGELQEIRARIATLESTTKPANPKAK